MALDYEGLELQNLRIAGGRNHARRRIEIYADACDVNRQCYPGRMLFGPPNDFTAELPVAWSLKEEEAQMLMDVLWSAGIRPAEGQGSAGQLAAVQAHLQDMRLFSQAQQQFILKSCVPQILITDRGERGLPDVIFNPRESERTDEQT